MALNRYRIGDLIKQRREKYDGSEKLYAYGVTRDGFIPPKQADADTSIYNVFYLNDFVFNPARMELNSIALNVQFNKAICSSLYEVFYVERTDLVLPEYLNLYIKRDEFARKCWFSAIGSARNYFRVNDLSEFEIDLPPIEIQKKYIDIYISLVNNQRQYEKTLNDIKTSYDAYYDQIKHENLVEIGSLIDFGNKKNVQKEYSMPSLRGINEQHRFVKTTANVNRNALDKYLVVDNGEFAVNFMCLGNWGKFYFAYNDSGNAFLVSPACSTIRIKNPAVLNPYYFLSIMQRSEFQRRCVFIGDSNTRGGINNDNFRSITIPMIEMKKQVIISNLFKAYEERKDINERLKLQIRNICPILIKGSLEEANK